MPSKQQQALKEKEKEQKLKALRKELDDQIIEQLEEAQFGQEEGGDSSAVQTSRLNEELLQNDQTAKQIIEALIFAASKPMTVNDIRKVTKSLTPSQIKKYAEELKKEYDETGRAFELLEIAGGYEISSRKDFAPWIMKVELQKKAKQASQSALETLAILAYKQPLTRAEIEELRGVDSSGVVSTLMERNFVKIVGRKEVPGRPFFYGTTEKFLEHFGLKDLKELPDIDEIKHLVEESVKKDELLGQKKEIEVEKEEVTEEMHKERMESIKKQREEHQAVLDEITDEVSSAQTTVDALKQPKAEEESEDGEADTSTTPQEN